MHMSEAQHCLVTRRDAIGVAAPIGRYSHVALVAPGMVTAYVSGQVGLDAKGHLVGLGAREQTGAAFANIGTILADLGASPAAIIKLLTFVAGIEHLPGFASVRDEVFEAWYPSGAPPAHSLAIVAGLAQPDLVVEIEAVVALVPR
jgi:enamine deaminase RidA (YjgF/YER057c/UK114 family)